MAARSVTFSNYGLYYSRTSDTLTTDADTTTGLNRKTVATSQYGITASYFDTAETAPWSNGALGNVGIVVRSVSDNCYGIGNARNTEDVLREQNREADGLALSSRNGYLTSQERPIATQLYQSLCWARQQIEKGRSDFAALEAEARELLKAKGMRPDYFSVIHQKTLEAATKSDKNIAILAAVYLGKTRLIDNVIINIGSL